MLSGIYITITDMMERREKRAGNSCLLKNIMLLLFPSA